MEQDNNGLRYNEGKPMMNLIPPEAILALGRHFTVGAQKYDKHNWLRGMDWTKCYDSLIRHILAWAQGEDFDKETGSHHMVAAAWNALALYIYHIYGIGNDDRLILGEIQK